MVMPAISTRRLEPLTVIRTMVRRMLAGSNAGGPSEYRFVRE
jgi:hypothetical protein